MEILTVFNRKMIYDINFIEPVTLDDMAFVRLCCDSSEYKKLITKEIQNYSDFLIICKPDLKIGICKLNILEYLGVKSAEPSVYISYRKSINTLKVINSIIYYLFNVCMVDRIGIKVLSINKHMIAIMSKSLFTYEGEIQYPQKLNGIYVKLKYYSLLKREFCDYVE